ncbi:MAG: pantetheine-phosphate adenylyltransferase [Phycisphaerales bacterium]|nr:pantetheine-phosphate adenylyltransferase [Phycisphaerales bacterium]
MPPRRRRAPRDRAATAPKPLSAPHVAVYPGSFDPVTYGHLDVIKRGRRLFDRIVVGVGYNPSKQTLFSAEERIDMLTRLVAEIVRDEPGLAPVEVHRFDGLTVDFARAEGAAVLLRGIRNLSDLQYEVQQAVTNREVAGLETAFVVAGQSFAYTSSTLIKQITALGKDLSVLSSMCPPLVIERLKKKKLGGHAILKALERDDA